MSSHTAASSRMTHRPHSGQIDLPHEKISKRVGAFGVERAPLIEVALNQRCPPRHSLVEEHGIARVDSIGTDGNNDVAVAGEDLLLVFISDVARNRLSRWSTRPLQKGTRPQVTRGVIAMQKYNQWKRTAGQVLGIIDDGAELSRLVRVSEGIVAIVVFRSNNREGTWVTGVLSMGRARQEQAQCYQHRSERHSLANHRPRPACDWISLLLSSVPKSSCLSPCPLPY